MPKPILHMLLCSFLLLSCTSFVNDKSAEQVDALNDRSAMWMYWQADSAVSYAQQAVDYSNTYSDGKARAYYLLGNAYLFKNKPDSAAVSLTNSLDATNNQFLRAKTFISLMHLYQSTSDSKQFYGARDKAFQTLLRIQEEEPYFEEVEKQYLQQIETDYYLASAAYFVDQQLWESAKGELAKISADYVLSDTVASIAYYYISALSVDVTDMDRAMKRFDRLLYGYVLSKSANNLYWQCRIQLEIASLLLKPDLSQTIYDLRHRSLLAVFPKSKEEEPLAYDLIDEAMSQSLLYGDEVMWAMACRVKAMAAVYEKDYSLSLSLLDQASGVLSQYRNPGLVARICELQSIVYSALSMKQESDSCRNVYLDILENTRLDRAIESRSERLQADYMRQQFLFWMLVILLVMCSAGLFYLYRFSRQKNQKRQTGFALEIQGVNEVISQGNDYSDGNKGISSLYMSVRKWLMQVQKDKESWTEAYSDTQERRQLLVAKWEEEKINGVSCRAKLRYVSALLPYLSRVQYDLSKARAVGDWQERSIYVQELLDHVVRQNLFLTDWIQLQRGRFALKLEVVTLNDLFDVLRKTAFSYAWNDIQLEITDTQLLVRADKALTLFMLTTLADNARKASSRGQRVCVYAQECGSLVEIVVQDEGKGLSEEEQKRLLSRKKTNFSQGGYGLSNCLSILEKYRKSSALFASCELNVYSQKGKGARFSFKLPRVLRSMLIMIGFSLWIGENLCAHAANVNSWMYNDSVVQRASQYADSAYFSNISAHYQNTLRYADSVYACLNKVYARFSLPYSFRLMTYDSLQVYKKPADLILYEKGLFPNYRLLLDVRNESAIAALALNQWNCYTYNNGIYTQLYRLTTQNKALERENRNIKFVSDNMSLVLGLLLLAIGIICLLCCMVYIRMYWLKEMKRRQIQELVMGLFAGCRGVSLLESVFSLLHESYGVKGARFVFATEDKVVYSQAFGLPLSAINESCAERCLASGKQVVSEENTVYCFPLQSLLFDKYKGAFVLNFEHMQADPEDIDLLARYYVPLLSKILFLEIIEGRVLASEITFIHDEMSRLEYEVSLLHVQNQIVDNILSSIKHETMYYPSRLTTMMQRMNPEQKQLFDMEEVVAYYQELLQAFLQQADRIQASCAVSFAAVPVERLFRTLNHLWKVRHSLSGTSVSLVCELASCRELQVRADEVLWMYLAENALRLINSQHQVWQAIRIEAVPEGAFVKFSIEGQALPDELVYVPDKEAVEFLLCSQVIRDHDAGMSCPGCRIDMEKTREGVQIWFTLPKVDENGTV